MTVNCIDGVLRFFLASRTACWFRFGPGSLFALRIYLLSAFCWRMIHGILAGVWVSLILLTMWSQYLCQLISSRKLTGFPMFFSLILSGLPQPFLSNLLNDLLWYLFGFSSWLLAFRHGLIRGLGISILDWLQTLLNLLLIRWCLFYKIWTW